MERFKSGDTIFIIPKFSHLYINETAIVTGVRADPSRPMFNEYSVEFVDGSTARLYEFQIIEVVPNLKTQIATSNLDGPHDEPPIKTRGPFSARRVVLETSAFHIDMRIRLVESGSPSIIGQVLERDRDSYLHGIAVRLMRDGMPVDATISDSLGVFEFAGVPEGPLNILVVIPRHSARIFGTFRA
jgi:hypothetical protein